MINIGEYIEMAVEWLTEHGASFFDLLSLGVEGVIDGILCVLLGIPFYITIAILTFLALYKSGRGTGIFTLLGLSLIYGMGFWEETMQTLALVLSSTGMALQLGIPLGIWMAGSGRCNKILQPVLDCMQTMPAFVYLIPAVLFFGLLCQLISKRSCFLFPFFLEETRLQVLRHMFINSLFRIFLHA